MVDNIAQFLQGWHQDLFIYIMLIITLQVQDPQPFPGLTIAPVCGVVPVGGMAELTLELLPNALIKFDTRVNIIIRGGKTLELRIAGAVEPPCVDIDLVSAFGWLLSVTVATGIMIVIIMNT